MSSTSVLRVFVTDDEAPARRKLLRFLAEEPIVPLIEGQRSSLFVETSDPGGSDRPRYF